MSPTTLQNCEDEPITIPGSIQSHGLLFTLHPETLEIEQATENCETILGSPAAELLGMYLTDLVIPSHKERFLRLVKEAAENYVNPFVIEFIKNDGSTLECHGIANFLEDNQLVLLELEPTSLEDSVGDSLENYFQLIQNSLNQSSSLTEVNQIADLMADRVQRFTGFDRVMIYRFAPDYSGEVIAEAAAEGMEPYLGLRYPATDIPAQARELYLRNWVRLLKDVDSETSPIFPVKHPRLHKPTPLDKSVLRSMSPIHLQYLRNMDVAATLTISLIIEGKLWGLIACHHRTPRFVSYGIRATSSLYGVVMSAQLARAERASLNQAQADGEQAISKLISKLNPLSSLESAFATCLPDLLAIFNADGAAFISDQRMICHGDTPDKPLIENIIQEIRDLSGDQLIQTSKLSRDFPKLLDSPTKTAGLLAIPLGLKTSLLVFRNQQTADIRWGGDPSAPKVRDSQGRLTPRESFAEWIEKIEGQSEPWPPYTPFLADELRSGLSSFALSKNRVLESTNEELQHFATVIAHEVKSQLQPPLMTLSLLKEKNLGDTMSEMVELGSNALSTLAEFTTEMLNFSQIESSTSDLDEVDLNQVVRMATEQAIRALSSEHLNYQIAQLPFRRASRSQSQHLFSNLIRNSIIHGPDKGQEDFLIKIGSEGEGDNTVFYVRDNGRGIDPKDQDNIFKYFYRGKNSTSRKGSGIGLGFTRRLLEKTGDRIWVVSEPGQGTTFYFTLGRESRRSTAEEA